MPITSLAEEERRWQACGRAGARPCWAHPTPSSSSLAGSGKGVTSADKGGSAEGNATEACSGARESNRNRNQLRTELRFQGLPGRGISSGRSLGMFLYPGALPCPAALLSPGPRVGGHRGAGQPLLGCTVPPPLCPPHAAWLPAPRLCRCGSTLRGYVLTGDKNPASLVPLNACFADDDTEALRGDRNCSRPRS